MATPESYRPEDSGSSPAPPELPERPPARFQFSLKQLLAFMFASAIVAAALRQIVLYFEQLPFREQFGLVNVVHGGLAIGGLIYFLVRGPFLAVGAGRVHNRWKQIEQHRRDLQTWGEARKREQGDKKDVPPGK